MALENDSKKIVSIDEVTKFKKRSLICHIFMSYYSYLSSLQQLQLISFLLVFMSEFQVLRID